MQKILVIEDAIEVRNLIAETLTLNGYQTYLAEDGEAGVAMAFDHMPDLVLCDVHMPRMDGYHVLKTLRGNPKTQTTPFVFLTGAADRTHVRAGMDLGADDYLGKPFLLEELTRMVDARLRKRHQVEASGEAKLDRLRDSITLALPHELMTPLNGIIGFASVLMQDHESARPQEVLEFSQHIYDSALRLQHLVENFLTYSQIQLLLTDPAKMALVRNVDPSHVADCIVAEARAEALRAKRSADLLLQVEEAAIAIALPKLQKIVSEIVGNAFKFSTPGTPVLVVSKRSGNHYQVSVIDHGRGLTPEHIAQLGPHVQIDRELYEQQGAGLGFTIARRLVELYGGTMTIESVPKQKTTVTISLAEVI